MNDEDEAKQDKRKGEEGSEKNEENEEEEEIFCFCGENLCSSLHVIEIVFRLFALHVVDCDL